MTRAQFLARFGDALAAQHADILTTVEGIYPAGPLLRVKVRAPWHTRLPPLLDPPSLVWFDTTGDFRGCTQGHACALKLGLSHGQAADLVLASDRVGWELTGGPKRWRDGLLEVLEAYRTDGVRRR